MSLIVRTKLEDDNFRLYGPTSIFRLAPRRPERVALLADIATISNETYVLQVDGVDDSYCDPHFEFYRHLPQEVPLTRREHDK